MAISNCLLSPTSENPCEFSAWFVLSRLSTNPRNYSYPRPLANLYNFQDTSHEFYLKINYENYKNKNVAFLNIICNYCLNFTNIL